MKVGEDAGSITRRLHASSIHNFSERTEKDLSPIAKKFKKDGLVVFDETIFNNRIDSKNMNYDNSEFFKSLQNNVTES